MSKMTEKQLLRCKAFLDYFGVDYSGKYVYLTDGGNSCIMNPKSEWKDFGGHSINGVAIAVSEQLGKKTKWKE